MRVCRSPSSYMSRPSSASARSHSRRASRCSSRAPRVYVGVRYACVSLTVVVHVEAEQRVGALTQQARVALQLQGAACVCVCVAHRRRTCRGRAARRRAHTAGARRAAAPGRRVCTWVLGMRVCRSPSSYMSRPSSASARSHSRRASRCSSRAPRVYVGVRYACVSLTVVVHVEAEQRVGALTQQARVALQLQGAACVCVCVAHRRRTCRGRAARRRAHTAGARRAAAPGRRVCTWVLGMRVCRSPSSYMSRPSSASARSHSRRASRCSSRAPRVYVGVRYACVSLTVVVHVEAEQRVGALTQQARVALQLQGAACVCVCVAHRRRTCRGRAARRRAHTAGARRAAAPGRRVCTWVLGMRVCRSPSSYMSRPSSASARSHSRRASRCSSRAPRVYVGVRYACVSLTVVVHVEAEQRVGALTQQARVALQLQGAACVRGC
ncbi:unnamed protein product [Arctia plantaginis]|uniref:Uncharacterized protein n=1 Tax=Arctia plantaginis TaxID=874455 RepID=A0A8S0Z6V6_ARCPL|nr:unnamed protein product [Arctia plantaginis]